MTEKQCCRRVLILGCPGSGKSYLSRRLSEQLGLPLISLDDEYWKPNWGRPAKEQWIARVEELVNEPLWIIDGHYEDVLKARLERADTIFFLDFSTWVCLRTILIRSLAWTFGKRSTLPKNIREDIKYRHGIRVHWPFLRLVLLFRRKRRSSVIAQLRSLEDTKRIFVMKNRRDVRAYLQDLEQMK